jgi:hypothetical protein
MSSEEHTKALPANSIMLHIGAHKTGTTSLQAALFAASKQLEEQGVINLVADGDETANPAARAVQRLPSSGSAGAPVDYNVWTTLVRQAQAHPNQLVSISAEAFAVSESLVIKQIVNDLGLDRLQVVITLRPLGKILPSQWQQDLHGAWLSVEFEEWLRQTLKEARPIKKIGPLQVPHQFWFRHRHDALLQRWIDAVGRDRITLVVADDQRKSSLLEHFEKLLSLSAGTLTSTGITRNQSMTLPEMQIMQRYGELLESSELGKKIVAQSRYHKALRILRKMRPENENDARLIVPAWSYERVSEIQHEVVERMQASGVAVIGTLNQLNWLPERSEVNKGRVSQVDEVDEAELERLTAKMLKSAARRLGIAETGSSDAPHKKRTALAALLVRAWAAAVRLARLGVRFIRLRT